MFKNERLRFFIARLHFFYHATSPVNRAHWLAPPAIVFFWPLFFLYFARGCTKDVEDLDFPLEKC